MAVSKVILNGTTLMDVTDKTVTASTLVSPNTALKNDGTTITGSLVGKSSSDVTVSGDTVIVPSGVYSSQVQKSVASGTAGMPTATKGTVSNHAVSVTPSVTNTTGYITGGTKTGTAVTVSASELVSGTKSISQNGTNIDVTDYAAVDVSVSGGTPNIQSLSVTTNGTYTASGNVDGYSPVVVNVSGGGTTNKAVNFIDYDGTLLHSYTASEWANVSALPSNPSHSGLTAQGWNWTKSQIDAQLTAYPNQAVWVGQMYITSSGKTEIDVTFDDPDYLSPYLSICPNGTVEIDWGDNSSTDTLTGTSLTSLKSKQHIYSSTGNYTIKIEVVSGEFSFYNASYNYGSVFSNIQSSFNTRKRYSYCVKNIRLGSGITSIKYSAFSNCFALTSLTIPSGVTSIETYTFYGCYALTSLTIPSGVTSIEDGAFSNCYSLTSLTIPSGVTSIGSSVFSACYALTSLTIPSGVTSIGTYAFNNCYALTSLTIPSGVTSIGNSAFNNCYALTSLTIPSGVTSIGSNTFNNCYALTSLTIPSGVTSIGNSAFNNCYALTSLTIPSGVTSIGNSVFNNCYSLTSLTIPSGVTSIGNSVFNSCHTLTSLTIPSGVTSIGNSAFSGCQTLTSLTIPSGVTSIGSSVFSACYSIMEYHFLSEIPPTLGTNAFSTIQAGTIIYVPTASVDDYKTATNWSTYASYIQGE